MRSRAQIFADVRDVALACFHTANETADTGAHLVETFRVLLFQPREPHHFGIDWGLLDDEGIEHDDAHCFARAFGETARGLG